MVPNLPVRWPTSFRVPLAVVRVRPVLRKRDQTRRGPEHGFGGLHGVEAHTLLAMMLGGGWGWGGQMSPQMQACVLCACECLSLGRLHVHRHTTLARGQVLGAQPDTDPACAHAGLPSHAITFNAPVSGGQHSADAVLVRQACGEAGPAQALSPGRCVQLQLHPRAHCAALPSTTESRARLNTNSCVALRPGSVAGPGKPLPPTANKAPSASAAAAAASQAESGRQAKDRLGLAQPPPPPSPKSKFNPPSSRAPQLDSARSVSAPGAAPVGVGMEFDSTRMIVTGLRPGCAAAYSKQISIGDQLIGVDGQECSDFKRARELILGVQGSTVSIEFKKNGSSSRYSVVLLRGTADYIHMAERCKHLDGRIAQLEQENKELAKAPSRPLDQNQVKAHVSAQVTIAALQKKVEELESENSEIQHALNVHKRTPVRNAPPMADKFKGPSHMLQEADTEKKNQMLSNQVAQLQKLIGEKDAQIKDVKAKSRDLQGSLARRLKDLEEVLKDRVEAKNERIVELNKQLMDSRAEAEGLRTENQSLRNVVHQTNMKLNALISMQMDAVDKGEDKMNQELLMLRTKTANLEAEIQRIKTPMNLIGQEAASESSVEVDGLQMDDDDRGMEGRTDSTEPSIENYPAQSSVPENGVELSTRPSQHTFTAIKRQSPVPPLNFSALNLNKAPPGPVQGPLVTAADVPSQPAPSRAPPPGLQPSHQNKLTDKPQTRGPMTDANIASKAASASRPPTGLDQGSTQHTSASYNAAVGHKPLHTTSSPPAGSKSPQSSVNFASRLQQPGRPSYSHPAGPQQQQQQQYNHYHPYSHQPGIGMFANPFGGGMNYAGGFGWR